MKALFRPFLIILLVTGFSTLAACLKKEETSVEAKPLDSDSKEDVEADTKPETAKADTGKAPLPEIPSNPDVPATSRELTVKYADLGYESDGTYSYEGKAFTGVADERFNDGKTSKRYEFKNGVFHGKTEEFYEDGKPMTLTHFDKGRRHGENTYWNPDGTVMKRQVYDHDVVIESTDKHDQEEIEARKKEAGAGE